MYLYRCHPCAAESPSRRPSWGEAEEDQRRHRDVAHGGLAPTGGDGIVRVHAERRGDRLLPRHTWVAVLVLIMLLAANCHGR